ncbi:DNA polymerase I [Raoultella ornithinolytica]|nr:DNA polymerase I [Raoultella ornithinolytica]
MAAKLEQNKEVAYLSYQLATIKTDVELDLSCEELHVLPPAADDLLALFKNMNLSAGSPMLNPANGCSQKALSQLQNRLKRRQ